MRLFRSRSGMVLLVAVGLMALFAFRPGVNGLRKRLANSIGLALGRQVDVAWVKLQILPQPGFDLENFVVHDDPAISAEPMLRAQEVTAALRLRSLLRGRLEIARLSLKEPSFNLVRSEDGHWNLESLLQRAARTPSVPTRNTGAEARPVFPYIEADNGRINFKIGPEKKAYTLTDADFALWLESDNQWGMRLQAQPMRTDFNLSDTGTIRLNGTWQRSDSLRQTPMQFGLLWDRAQLGQFTKLLYGNDKGWRGGITIAATFSGMPADLGVNAQVAIQGFRRYDIVSTQPLRLETRCKARYSSVQHLLSQIICRAPVGQGVVTLRGDIAAPTGPRGYDLALIAQNLPIQSLIALARGAKKDLPEDLAATGIVNANVSVRTGTASASAALDWQGAGEATDFSLHSDSTKADLALGTIPFAIASEADLGVIRKHSNKTRMAYGALAGTQFDLGPFPIITGKSSSATVRGWIAKSGYSFSVQGDAQVQRLLQVAKTLGLHAPQPVANGAAKVDLQIAGEWAGYAAPEITGSAQLHAVRAEVRGMNEPLEIASADLLLSADTVQVENLSASAGGTRWSGSLTLPRKCTSPAPCPAEFVLSADTIRTDDLSQLLSYHPRERPWYRFLSPASQQGPSLLSTLSTLNASGTLVVNQALIHGLVVNRISGHFQLQDGKLQLDDVRGELLGGKHRGNWEANFRANPPAYSGTGVLESISLGQLADAMHDGWITGMGDASYRFAASGLVAGELLSSATGTLQFEMRDGMLPHIAPDGGSTALHIRRFSGRMILRDGTFEVTKGKLETPEAVYQVSGTASLGQKLDVKFVRNGARGFNVTGTLSAPHVIPATAPETRAALKP